MKQLSCVTHQCSNYLEVSNDVESVLCSTCFSGRITRIDIENEIAVQELKNSVIVKDVPVNKRVRWSTAEDKIVIENCKEHNIKELMEMLMVKTGVPRTAGAVENRIWHLKMEHVAKQKYVDQIIGG